MRVKQKRGRSRGRKDEREGDRKLESGAAQSVSLGHETKLKETFGENFRIELTVRKW